MTTKEEIVEYLRGQKDVGAHDHACKSVPLTICNTIADLLENQYVVDNLNQMCPTCDEGRYIKEDPHDEILHCSYCGKPMKRYKTI